MIIRVTQIDLKDFLTLTGAGFTVIMIEQNLSERVITINHFTQ